MRPAVRAATILGVLIVAGCAVYAVLFVRSTNMRIDRLETYLDGRRNITETRYDETSDRIDNQQQQIRLLQQQLCAAVPATCNGATP